MRVERIPEHVWALSTWVVVPIRVWVVATEDGVTLVDAGLSTMARGILEFIARLGAGRAASAHPLDARAQRPHRGD